MSKIINPHGGNPLGGNSPSEHNHSADKVIDFASIAHYPLARRELLIERAYGFGLDSDRVMYIAQCRACEQSVRYLIPLCPHCGCSSPCHREHWRGRTAMIYFAFMLHGVICLSLMLRFFI